MFSEEEIEAARRLRRRGLIWRPRAGHYVFDETGFCKQGSPFQQNVYFILNLNYFVRSVGGLERFKEIMLWLPTWDDLRESLRGFGVSDCDVARQLRDQGAIESGRERLELYRMVESCLPSPSEPHATAEPPARA